MPTFNTRTAEQARRNDEALPSGRYYLEVFAFDADPTTAVSKSGKYMPHVDFKILQPTEFAGRRLFPSEYFVLGTDNDLAYDSEDTVGSGLGRLKRFLDAAGAACEGDVEDVLSEVQTVGAVIERYVEPASKNGVPNEYAGQVKNRIKSYFAVGDQVAEIFPDASGGTASTAKSKVAGLRSSVKGLAAKKA